MLKTQFFLLVFLALLYGCVSNVRTVPQVTENQDTVYQDGIQTLVSQKENSLVMIRPSQYTSSTNQRPRFVVTIFNSSPKPFEFSTDNLSVELNNHALRVFLTDELIAEVTKKRLSSVDNNSILRPTYAHPNYEKKDSVEKGSFTNSLLNNDKDLTETILRDTTVFPMSWHGGYVEVDKTELSGYKNHIIVRVNILNEQHVFRFYQTEAQ